MEDINEGSSAIFTIDFYDENNANVTPDLVTYRIDDISSSEILAPVEVVPSSSSMDIVVGSDLNVILDPTSNYEMRYLTIVWIYSDGTKQGTEEVIFRVKNLFRV